MSLDASSHLYQRVRWSVRPIVTSYFQNKKMTVFLRVFYQGSLGTSKNCIFLGKNACWSVRLSMLKVEKKGWKDVSISWSSLFGLCPMGYEETWNAFPCCWKVSLVYSLSFQLQLGFLIVTYRSSLHHFSVFALSAIASLDTISMPFVCLWLFSLVGHAAFKNATSFIGNFFCSRQKVSLPSALL